MCLQTAPEQQQQAQACRELKYFRYPRSIAEHPRNLPVNLGDLAAWVPAWCSVAPHSLLINRFFSGIGRFPYRYPA